MKKLFLFLFITITSILNAQKTTYSDIEKFVKNSVKQNVLEKGNKLLDFKIDSLGVKSLTEKETLFTVIDYYTKMSAVAIDDYEDQKELMKSLPPAERIDKINEIQNKLRESNNTEKQKVLLSKYLKADDKKNSLFFQK